jgi:hypothetical protein
MTVTIADFRRDHIDMAMALFDSIQKGRDTHAIELDVTDHASFARAADEVYAKSLQCARMRIFTKYVDEYFRPALSQIGWQMMIHTITDKLSKEEFEAKLARIPREEKREKWRIASAQGYTPEQMAAWHRTLAEGIGTMEAALSSAPWLAGPHYSMADIACFAMAAHMPDRFTDIMNTSVSPRVLEWHARMAARPAVAAALAMSSPVRAANTRW